MNVFLTGASGYIGRHVAQELVSRGHRVIGLSRRESDRTRSLGEVQWCFGELSTPESYVDELQSADAVVHCAMDYSSTGENSELDLVFVESMSGFGGQFIYTGNLFSNRTQGRLEESLQSESKHWRFQSESAALNLPSTSAVVRLGFVYGGSGGYFWHIVSPGTVAELMSSEIPEVLWPMIHVRDAATLYATVLETKAEGVFHGYDGRPTSAREVIDAARSLYEASGVTDSESENYIKGLLQSSVPTSNNRSRSIGWSPKHASFLDSIESAYSDREGL